MLPFWLCRPATIRGRGARFLSAVETPPPYQESGGGRKSVPTFRSSSAQISQQLDAAISVQIGKEFSSAVLYFGLSAWFSRPSVAMPGMSAYFGNNYKEELEHSSMLVNYQVRRLGRLRLPTGEELSTPAPDLMRDELTPVSAMDAALDREEELLKSLNRMAVAADDEKDYDAVEFFSKMAAEQVSVENQHYA